MHLLYLDDAGSVGNVHEQYLVLGGVFEAQSHWITQELDSLAQSIDAGNPHGVEFHASGDLRPAQSAMEGPESRRGRQGRVKT